MGNLQDFSTFAYRFEKAISAMNPKDFSTTTRDGGWTRAQVIHHLADAQTQAYYRIKWLLTEENTMLKTFDQDSWADLTDSTTVDVKGSINMILGVYHRWTLLMNSLTEEQWQKTGSHLEIGEISVKGLFEFYANHGENHLKSLSEA